MGEYDLRKVRNLLVEGFTETDLRQFCFYEPSFRPVYDSLPARAGKIKIVQDLLVFAETHELFPPLLAWAKTSNLARYTRYEPYQLEPAPATPSTSSTESRSSSTTPPSPATTPRHGYYTYRIRVANLDEVQVEKRNDRNELLGEPPGKFRFKEWQAKIQPLADAARYSGLAGEQVRELGELLFEALFDEAVRLDFVTLYDRAVHQEEKLLRIELDVDERGWPELAALPWEFMRVPKSANLGALWLATAPKLIFSRRRRKWNLPRRLQLDPGEKLRIGLVVSAPNDQGAVVYEPLLDDLNKLAQEQGERIELLPVLYQPNPDTLTRLLGQKPHIFHFIGHGRFDDQGEEAVGQLALVQKSGAAWWVDADNFAELLNQYRPGVVLLQACEGGALSAAQAFVGVGSQVVDQNIPVVVAMQYLVTNDTASRFAQRFYERLAQDDPVDQAAQYGRRAIALGPNQYESRDFATPVIFMRAEDGHLFERSQKG